MRINYDKYSSNNFLFGIWSCGTPGKKVAPSIEIAVLLARDTHFEKSYFEPNRILKEVGNPLKLTLKKRSGFLGIKPHDFNLMAPEAGLDIVTQKVRGGNGITITITPALSLLIRPVWTNAPKLTI